NQLITRLLQDIQHVHDMAQHDVKEAHNMRIFIQSLHDATYQHRFEYVFFSLQNCSHTLTLG
ncbi:unnamed protein product, partial [Rotaria magnacalcarata]